MTSRRAPLHGVDGIADLRTIFNSVDFPAALQPSLSTPRPVGISMVADASERAAASALSTCVGAHRPHGDRHA
jgi:hypothetical protein